jgi:hypothetical protein
MRCRGAYGLYWATTRGDPEMKAQKKEWYYIDEETGQQVGPVTLDNLDAARRAGKIEEYSHVINAQMLRRQGPGASGIPYSMISRLDVDFTPTVEAFHAAREGELTTVLSGPNNCGKTLLLKQLFLLVGHDGYLIACNRFSHIDILNTRQAEAYEYRRYYDNFSQNYYMSRQNSEDNELKLEQVITSLKDKQREKLFSACKDLLGNEFSLKRTDPENMFSPFYVDMDGENLRYGSSGTRLLLTLLGILLDERFAVLLIDEPEIGLSPRIQAVLARFLYDQERRRQFCPHLRQIYVATHSHLFLDRDVLANNHVVTKVGNIVSIRPVRSVADYHQLQFNMLGNELETISLPSAIVLVEGESDATFLGKVVQLHVPDRKVSIVRAEGEGEVLKKLNFFKEAFGDLATSPYRDRLFVVLDKQISVRIPRIEGQGVPNDNIVLLSQNGIEYFYPAELVATIFRCTVEEVRKWKFETDAMDFNGIRKTKKELAQCVADALTGAHRLHSEIEALVGRIRAACK